MDASFKPEGLLPCGGHGMQVFCKEPREQEPRPKVDAPRQSPQQRRALLERRVRISAAQELGRAPAELPATGRFASAVRQHLMALAAQERGDADEEGRLISELLHRHPDYLPGVLESALWLQREGRNAEARLVMRSLESACEGRDPGELVEGLMPLPLSALLAAAQAFLKRPAQEP
jgi:hypothetical protein